MSKLMPDDVTKSSKDFTVLSFNIQFGVSIDEKDTMHEACAFGRELFKKGSSQVIVKNNVSGESWRLRKVNDNLLFINTEMDDL